MRLRCATFGCNDKVTETITYNYRNAPETTSDDVCTPCADGYSRRPVLANFTRKPYVKEA